MLLCFCSIFAKAGNLPVFSNNNLTSSGVNFIPFTNIYQTPDSLSPLEIAHLIEGNQLKISPKRNAQGFSKDFFWLHFKINHDAKNATPLILELDNPRINEVRLYKKTNTQFQQIGLGGDYNFQFQDRTFINRRYIFPLLEDTSTEYLMMINKRNTSISFPLTIWNKTDFEKTENQQNIFYGIFFGSLWVISFLSFGVGAALRNRLLLLYGLYVFLCLGYFFTHLGFSFQYIYPSSITFNNFSSTIIFAAIICTLTFFIRAFLEMDQYYPKLSTYFYSVNLIFFALFLIWFFFKPMFLFNNAPFLLNVLTLLGLSVFISSFFIAIKTMNTIHRKDGILFLAAFTCLILSYIYATAIEYGWGGENVFPISPIFIGSGVEVFILSIAMIGKLKSSFEAKTKFENQAVVLEKNVKELEIEKSILEKNNAVSSPINTSPISLLLKSKALLSLDDISHISSDGHYLEFFLFSKKNPEIDRNTIKAILEQLPTQQFVRIHRSHIVNVEYIKLVKSVELTLKNGKTLPISRTYRPAVKQLFSSH